MPRPIAWLVGAFLVGACVGSPTASPLDTQSVEPTPTATPSPTPGSALTIAELAGIYLECADAYNAESARLYDEERRSSTLEALASIYERHAANDEAFIGCVSDIPWPPPLDAGVRDLVETITLLQAVETEMASAPSLDAFRGYQDAWAEAAAASAAAASQLRDDLGLPPPPGG